MVDNPINFIYPPIEIMSSGWFTVTGTLETAPPAQQNAVIIFHLVMAVVVLVIIGCMIGLLVNTVVSPAPLKGWTDGLGGLQWDYDAKQGSRKSLASYIKDNGYDDSTPMNSFAVATANFGGIFTEPIGSLYPYNGTVSTEAARLQVEAGARAVVLDIWPDPRDLRTPVVCTMKDNSAWSSWWYNTGGLKDGLGAYSNWQQLTRNCLPAAEIMNTLITTAFDGTGTSQQTTDPFFLILRLHGGMTIDYLNTLGKAVTTAIGGHAMGGEWNRFHNQSKICTEPVSSFMSKVFVIVSPDISSNYYILPNINSYPAFISVFSQTALGEATNALESSANSIVVTPENLGSLKAASQNNTACSGVAGQQSLIQTGFTVVQPSVGDVTTNNDLIFKGNIYSDCVASGAQFVAVNLFSPYSGDSVLKSFLNDTFGTYSFKLVNTPHTS